MAKSSAEIVVGLGFGDEGKGTTVDCLTRHREAHTVVRFNGGAQAGHNVVLPDGTHHRFAQFGSGTFAGARTLLSRFMIVNPVTALVEAALLEPKGILAPLGLLTVEDEALVTTPFHVALNRLRELSRADRHGSCGMGIGETVADSIASEDVSIHAGDLRDPDRLWAKLVLLQELKMSQASALDVEVTDAMRVELDLLFDQQMVDVTLERFARFASKVRIVGRDVLSWLLREPGTVIFEGAQGVLLDESFGFHPHTTWSNCTFGNAVELIGDADVKVRRLGVVRTVQTRHGAGPFVTEDPRMLDRVTGDHNATCAWQGSFRAGALDLVATRYAIDACGGIDGLVVTWADRVGDELPVCTKYVSDSGRLVGRLELPSTLQEQAAMTEWLRGMEPDYERLCGTDVPEAISDRLCVPFAMASFGPTHFEKELVES